MRLEWEQYKERQKVGINCKGKVKRNLGYFYRVRKRLAYQIADTLFIKGILVMALLVLLHQTLSHQSAMVAQIGLIALAGFFFWAINKMIDQWRLSHPLKITEYDEENLYHSDGKNRLTIPLANIQMAVTLAGPAYGSRKNLQVVYFEEESVEKVIQLSIPIEDLHLFEGFCEMVIGRNSSFVWQDEG